MLYHGIHATRDVHVESTEGLSSVLCRLRAVSLAQLITVCSYVAAYKAIGGICLTICEAVNFRLIRLEPCVSNAGHCVMWASAATGGIFVAASDLLLLQLGFLLD